MDDIFQKWLADPQQRSTTVSRFRLLFLTPEGQIVLTEILDMLKFMQPAETPADVALNNFAKDLLSVIYRNTDNTVDMPGLWGYIKKIWSYKNRRRTK
jgi:hypothetical protein